MWLKISSELMSSSGDIWISMMKAAAPPAGEPDFQGAYDAWLNTMKLWRTPGLTGASPWAAKNSETGFSGFPDLMLGLTKPVWEALNNMAAEFAEAYGSPDPEKTDPGIDKFMDHVSKAWKEIYEREFRKFLGMPQVGLTRAYQRRLNEAIDKFNIYNTALTEFYSILWLPMEKSFQIFHQELAALAEQGKTPTNARDYYKIWLKILEDRYMSLFRSEDYNERLARTLNAMAEFAIARERAMEDALQGTPVTTAKDMDEVYRELYELKKRVKTLEKRLETENRANGKNG
jgi:hypothetical protein